MSKAESVFVADSCIGGLSVLKSLWNAGYANEATFLADYQINPIGMKGDAMIADVVERWLKVASKHGDTLIMACNTLSVRYKLLQQSGTELPQIEHVISMVDCFEVMVRAESESLVDKKVLVIGTRYTASQSVYRDILTANITGVRVETIAATELERQIARIEPWDGENCEVLTGELREAIEDTDVAVLACTCFPMVQDALEVIFPNVVFLDPGAYCSELLQGPASDHSQEVRLKTTGNVVTAERAADFARSYLDSGSVIASSMNKQE
jgi:glutamate racemase